MTNNTTFDFLRKTIAPAFAGIIIGWGSTALTLSGRVTAIEAGQTRIESRLDLIIVNQANNVAHIVEMQKK